ncbi:spermatogenesis-associated protein 31D3-like [Mustela lutreola]|uniref:spermatogenesis-associated protein 31D3-like n=1 Tax=Mustela lutreola TaxID=9666 RepID=UPI002797BA7D|nr:spermatogenesis-associated protein 31D3-like [Mustela lutreola]
MPWHLERNKSKRGVTSSGGRKQRVPFQSKQVLISMIWHPLFLSGAARTNQRSYICISSTHIRQPWRRAIYSKPPSSSSGVSKLHIVSPPSAPDASDNISNASPEQECPVVSHPLPPSLPENPPQLLPQTQPLPIPYVQPQAHLQSLLLILPSGPLPDIKISGVYFHRPQNESESLMSTEMQHLEWNVLHKVQERVWGLPTIVQRSQEDYCPSAPNHSPKPWVSQAHAAIFIPHAQFPLSDEIQNKRESSSIEAHPTPVGPALQDL